MGVSGAVQWWEEWQLRILVLGSMVIQYLLVAASVVRKFPVRSWLRPFIWLVYLGSDAVAIYALATLFNRRKPEQEDGDGGSSILEALWAPILLIHLGGQDGITAYNIEDNELWTRHILTSVSQVTVAIYVFCKSWQGSGDTNLLVAAILLFIPGILKCFEKPLALNRASINSLVSSSEPIRRSIDTQKLKIDPLEGFIDKAISSIGANDYPLAPATQVDFTPYKLFVDLASPSIDDRVSMLRSFSALDDHCVYRKLQSWLSRTFQFVYTKEKMFTGFIITTKTLAELYKIMKSSPALFFGLLVRGVAMYLPFAAIALFHQSHREAYSEDDVKVTYALLSCTAVLEYWASALNMNARTQERSDVQKRKEKERSRLSILFKSILSTLFKSISAKKKEKTLFKSICDDKVYQYNLIGLLIRNRRYSRMMWAVGVLGCSDFLQQRWRMKSSSSFSITKLVLKYVKGGWEHHIRDVSSYRNFNDNRGQFTLQHQGCYQELAWSLEGAFDESVLLWHLATDFCYYDKRVSHHGPRCTQDSCPPQFVCPAWCKGTDKQYKRAVQCREMSNYMMYLLYVNPEMLMAGTRRNLFTAAYDELKDIDIKRDTPPVEKRELTPAMRRERCRNKVQGIIPEGGKQPLNERELTQRIIVVLDGGGTPSAEGTLQKKGIIHDAWTIAKVLSGLSEDKMWTVIEGVWVEMLCFSAARCRGYLHAKGLATGVEYLTYVWLLQYYMGMETLASKLQRVDHHNGGEHGDDPSSSRASRAGAAQEEAVVPSRSSGGAAEEEHAKGQSAGYHDSYGIVEEIV